jgi:hypothetical protein
VLNHSLTTLSNEHCQRLGYPSLIDHFYFLERQ